MRRRLTGLALVSVLAAVAAPATALAQEQEPASDDDYARANRFAMALSFGAGWTDLDRFGDFAADTREVIESMGATVNGSLAKNHHVTADLSFRYYAPYYVLAQLGFGAVYNWVNRGVEAGAASGSVENHQLVLELPILVGAYAPVHPRINAYGAIGPSGFFFARSFWDSSFGGVPDFEGDGGVGMHLLAGAEAFAAEQLSIGLELHYRYFDSGKLEDQDSGTEISTSDGKPVTLEFQSVSVMVNLRMFFL